MFECHQGPNVKTSSRRTFDCAQLHHSKHTHWDRRTKHAETQRHGCAGYCTCHRLIVRLVPSPPPHCSLSLTIDVAFFRPRFISSPSHELIPLPRQPSNMHL